LAKESVQLANRVAVAQELPQAQCILAQAISQNSFENHHALVIYLG